MPRAEQDRMLTALKFHYANYDWEPAERAMLDYAYKLTVTPGQMNADDVASLRQTGFDDLAIHDICAVTAYFAFVNRIADGLGVEIEG